MLVGRLLSEARPGDIVITMGAGDVYKVAEVLARKLRTRGPTVFNPEKRAMELQADLKALLSEKARIRRDEPMARHTSMRIGGPAEVWGETASERDLARRS